MPARVNSNISIENAEIGFRNFSGKAGKYNAEGNRNFCIFLDPELGNQLEADGWNIRRLDPKDKDDIARPYIQAAVSYANIPPHIVLVTSKSKTLLDEDSINILDWAEISNVDLIVRPYNWVMHEGTKNEKSGVKAYVKSMYVTIVEDEFADKYVNVPDSAVSALARNVED
jgi:hypothetical protein